MAKYTYDELMADLKKNQYTPKTQEQLQQEAAARYDSVYAQKNLAAQQAADASALALDNQLASLGLSTAKQKEESVKQYTQAASQAERSAIAHGMGRSSYNLATQSNIATAGNKALQGIADAETATRTGIQSQKAMLATQLAQQLEQYASGKTSDTNAYLDELLNREYERTAAADAQVNAIAQHLFQLGYQTDRDKLSDEQWKKTYELQQQQLAEEKRQFDVKNPAKSSSGRVASKTTKQQWSNDEYRRALDIVDKYGEAKARSYIRGLGLPKDQEAVLMRKAGVYTPLPGESMEGTGKINTGKINAGVQPNLQDLPPIVTPYGTLNAKR